MTLRESHCVLQAITLQLVPGTAGSPALLNVGDAVLVPEASPQACVERQFGIDRVVSLRSNERLGRTVAGRTRTVDLSRSVTGGTPGRTSGAPPTTPVKRRSVCSFGAMCSGAICRPGPTACRGEYPQHVHERNPSGEPVPQEDPSAGHSLRRRSDRVGTGDRLAPGWPTRVGWPDAAGLPVAAVPISLCHLLGRSLASRGCETAPAPCAGTASLPRSTGTFPTVTHSIGPTPSTGRWTTSGRSSGGGRSRSRRARSSGGRDRPTARSPRRRGPVAVRSTRRPGAWSPVEQSNLPGNAVIA